jgi:O-succinylbenzoic acid--CoA ligase
LAHLKAVVLGGAPAPAGLIDAALAARVPLVTTYGLTETSSQICATHPGDPHEALYTSGRPLAPGCVRIAEGEIQVAGPTLFAGYWDGGELRLPRTEDGWFATGDLGHWDSGGRLVVRGRKDNLFISGGENIQPEEIEAELCRAEGVLRAVVVSRADPQWGARPVAFVETLPGRQFDPAAWEAALAERLPRFKLPVAYRPWPADLAGVKAPRAELSRRV